MAGGSPPPAIARPPGRAALRAHDDAALVAYRRNFEGKTQIGAADEYRSVQSAARILARKEEFDAALKTLARADIEGLGGFWKHSILLVKADVLSAAGRNREAIHEYSRVAGDESASESHRNIAQAGIQALNQNRYRTLAFI